MFDLHSGIIDALRLCRLTLFLSCEPACSLQPLLRVVDYFCYYLSKILFVTKLGNMLLSGKELRWHPDRNPLAHSRSLEVHSCQLELSSETLIQRIQYSSLIIDRSKATILSHRQNPCRVLFYRRFHSDNLLSVLACYNLPRNRAPVISSSSILEYELQICLCHCWLATIEHVHHLATYFFPPWI